MIQIPSIFYYIALFIWPLVAIRLFKKYPIENATFLCVLAPYLLLPIPPDIAPMDLPLLPPLDKQLIPIVTLFFILLRKKVELRFTPAGFLPKLFVYCLLLGPLLTAFTNPDQRIFGPKVLPALTIKDAIGIFLVACMEYYLPFIIGYSVLNSVESHRKIVRMLAVGGLIYTIPMLYEIRMSPQLHVDIYGFFPHDFAQQKRGGGFRPVVFLGHGLIVAFFAMLSAICVYTMVRQKDALFRGKGWLVLGYMLVVLVLCKTFSAVIYFMFFLSACLFLTERGQLRLASAIAMLLLIYPIVRTSGVIPFDAILEFFRGIDEERAGSLQFRIDNEESLLAHANERKWFGWGNWGRNHIYHEVSGKMLSVTDGSWVVVIGSMGWVGFLGVFGLLCYPIIVVSRLVKQKGNAILDPNTRALTFVVALYALDQIPNASLTQLSFVISGALLGWVTNFSAKRASISSAAKVSSGRAPSRLKSDEGRYQSGGKQ